MTFVFVFSLIGLLGMVVLGAAAVRLFGVFKDFTKELGRVSQELGDATSDLERAAASLPNFGRNRT
jgi:hypothetical protein